MGETAKEGEEKDRKRGEDQTYNTILLYIQSAAQAVTAQTVQLSGLLIERHTLHLSSATLSPLVVKLRGNANILFLLLPGNSANCCNTINPPSPTTVHMGWFMSSVCSLLF